jgi:hypothetical protein
MFSRQQERMDQEAVMVIVVAAAVVLTEGAEVHGGKAA